MKTDESERLGEELFRLVEPSQGHAFISDGITAMPPEAIFDAARASLRHTEETARKLRAWLKKYGQPLR